MVLHIKMENFLNISKCGVLIFNEQLFLWCLFLDGYDYYDILKFDCIVRL